MTATPARAELLTRLRHAIANGTLVKLTLAGPGGADRTLKKVLVRPVSLHAGPRLSFVYRYAAKDITKNFLPEEGVTQVAELLGRDFLTAHLFTTEETAELELREGKPPRLSFGKPSHTTAAVTTHDRSKARFIEPKDSPWLQALGVANADGIVRMGAKFKQINKFVEILQSLLAEMPADEPRALRLVDMGCGKGYLTFAAFDYLRRSDWASLNILGLEARAELVEQGNRVARECRFDGLRFACGTIESTALDQADVLVALHACDTATDDAIAKGLQVGASLILVAPCCHKELRPQLRPPPVLAGALKHGILRERQAEFVTDALRAALLEWAGYATKVFEFISPEHTAKNLMIAAVKQDHSARRDVLAQQVRELAAFYGIKSQRLAQQLAFDL